MDSWELSSLYSLVLILLVIGSLCGAFLTKWARWAHTLSHLFSLAAGLLNGALAFAELYTQIPFRIHLWPITPYWTLTFHIDPLSAFFLLIISVVSVPVSFYSLQYMTFYHKEKNISFYGTGLNLFLLSMVAVVTADDGGSFLLSWELMSLLSFFLLVFEHEKPEVPRASYIYLTMTHFGTAFLILAFLLFDTYSGSFQFESFHQQGTNLPPEIRHLLFGLILIGFGTKAGIVPLHVWLPRAHPVAPTPVSALMSAVMIKTAIYGIIRFSYDFLGVQTIWWGVIVLFIGVVTALTGILYGLLERDMKRFLAYSSVENIGVILIGLGSAFLFSAYNLSALAAFALSASLFHVLNHALFKGLLFLGAGSIYYATHLRNMEQLGGLIKRMPFTAIVFLMAGLSLASFPPFNGFISEWMTYQSLYHLAVDTPTPIWKIGGILALAALGLTGALVAGGVVKMFGTSFLALPRSEQAEKATEVPLLMKIGMGLLALGTLLFGLFPGFILKMIDGVIQYLGILTKPNHPISPIHIPYPSQTAGSISIFIILVVLLLIFGFLWAMIRLYFGKSSITINETWNCGTRVQSSMEYTPTSYSHPIQTIFRWLFLPRSQTIDDKRGYFPKQISYRLKVINLFELIFYRPWVQLSILLAQRVRSIQNGNLQGYLGYMFLTLLLLLFLTRRW
ncbi:MAG TPA: proton-conducting transporter membrane subunit [Bacillota bacterium]|nr:proton-conducting transporter membrane subunit [Bacillota bacterium]